MDVKGVGGLAVGLGRVCYIPFLFFFFLPFLHQNKSATGQDRTDLAAAPGG